MYIQIVYHKFAIMEFASMRLLASHAKEPINATLLPKHVNMPLAMDHQDKFVNGRQPITEPVKVTLNVNPITALTSPANQLLHTYLLLHQASVLLNLLRSFSVQLLYFL